MIDYFAIGLTHGLLALAALRLLARADLDDEDPAKAKGPVKPWLKNRRKQGEAGEAGPDA